ncbi:MAG: carbohydrate kinase [Firmicutes bacterium]|nr:carbohydrate kinase [Bacillota bacterium]
MSTYDLLIIGHVTRDIQEYQGKRTKFTGGAAFFSPIAASRSKAKVCVVTKMAEEHQGVLDILRNEGIDVICLPSSRTTSIENTFISDDVDKRRVRLLSQADPFTIDDLPDVSARIYDLAGLFIGEIPPEMIAHLAPKGPVALDMQAMLRYSEGEKFGFRDWPEKREYLPMVTYLKADSQESEVCTGTADRERAARILFDLGAKEVMITHASEVIVYDGRRIYRAPFNPANLSGRNGRGDTCFASYMTWRFEHDVEESVRYAAALTSIKMEKFGPFSGTIQDVLTRMQTL